VAAPVALKKLKAKGQGPSGCIFMTLTASSPVCWPWLTLIRIRIRIFLGSEKLDLGELFDIFLAQHDWKNIGGVTVKFNLV
jgi:hypothetical protein